MILLAIGLIAGVIGVNSGASESAHQLFGEGCLQNTVSPYYKDTSQLRKGQRVIVDVLERVVRDDKVETLRRIVNRQHVNRCYIIQCRVSITRYVPALTRGFDDSGKPALRCEMRYCSTFEPVNDSLGGQVKQQMTFTVVAATIWTPKVLLVTSYRLQRHH